MKSKNSTSNNVYVIPRRNQVLAIYIAAISTLMISYSIVTAAQYL
jgi:hypothetical protein